MVVDACACPSRLDTVRTSCFPAISMVAEVLPEAVERNGGKLLRRWLVCIITGDRVLKSRVWGGVAHLSPVFLNEQPFPALPIVPQRKTAWIFF